MRAVLLLVLLSSAALAQGEADQRALEQKLERERQTVLQLTQKESSLLGRLAEVERQIEVEGRALRAAQARLRTAQNRLTAAEAKAKTADDEVARATDALAPRLTARYRLGREGYVRFLLGARSIAEVLHRKRLFTALLESDFDALAALRFKSEGARAARDELAAARDEQGKSVVVEQDKRVALEARVGLQRRMLASVQQDRREHEQAARELEDAAKELASKLHEIAKEPAPPPQPHAALAEPSIRTLRGKLLFPVQVGRVEQRFGRAVDPHFGTVTLQRGIDVRAPEGTPVRAVAGGRVVHAGWFRGYGNLVIVDHGEGVFSLMAHLATLERAVGEQVSRGDRVGTVGDTGSLKGAYLYFELRDGQKPLDPERWLSRDRRAPGLVAR